MNQSVKAPTPPPKDAPWALITGASAGIGNALAGQLARGGYRLVLVARNQERLDQLAHDLNKRHSTQSRVIATDLSQPSAVASIVETLKNENIAIQTLINNAGFGLHGEFAKTDWARELEMIDLHITACLQLTKALLPQMLTTKHGHILNIGSVYSFSPVPRQSVYSATKAFILSFSESLRHELKGSGVSVTVLCPGITRTEFRSRMGLGEAKAAGGMDPLEVAQIGIEAMQKAKFLAIPGLSNQIYVGLAHLLPRSLMTRFISWLNTWRLATKKN